MPLVGRLRCSIFGRIACTSFAASRALGIGSSAQEPQSLIDDAVVTRDRRVHFSDDAHDEVRFDPLDRPRLDVDLTDWAKAGPLKVSQTVKTGRSPRDDPLLRTMWIEGHFSKGFPTPPQHIRTCEAIARRNAIELESHIVGHATVDNNGWPQDDTYTYGPKRRYLDPKGRTHIDDLPTDGSFEQLPLGVHAPIDDTDDEVDVISDPLDQQSTIGGRTVQVPSSTTSASSSLQYPEPLASEASSPGPLASSSSQPGSLTRDLPLDPDAWWGGSSFQNPQPISSGRAPWADITCLLYTSPSPRDS